MSSVDYDFSGAGSSITDTEQASIDEEVYSIIVLQGDFTIDGFYITSDYALVDTSYAVIYPVMNEALKTLTIDNCDFNMYGTGMTSTTAFNFESNNCTFHTEQLVAVYYIEVS